MTGVIPGKENSQAGEEPMTSGDSAKRGEPKFWVEGKKRISRVDVHEERDVRVGRRREFLYNDGVTFKGTIAFVRR